MSVQLPLHKAPFPEQTAWQPPLTQNCPLAQVLPQPPQLLGSSKMSVQPLSQATRPVAQGWQAPAVHVLTGPQATRHAPQLEGSELVSVQPAGQAVSAPGQD